LPRTSNGRTLINAAKMVNEEKLLSL
jgi:hypothetical protein